MDKGQCSRKNSIEVGQAVMGDMIKIIALLRILLQFYRKEAFDELLQHTYRYAVNHPEKILVYLSLIDGWPAGTNQPVSQSLFHLECLLVRSHRELYCGAAIPPERRGSTTVAADQRSNCAVRIWTG